MAAEGYKTLKFKPGQTIFSEGDEGDSAYIVQSGTVKVIKAGSTGKEVVIAKVTKGGIIGEMAVVEQAPRFATVKAVDDVKLMVVSRESFLKRLSGLDRFTNVLLQTLIGRLKTQSQKTVELAVRHAEQITKAGGGPKPAVTLGGQHGQKEYDFTGVEMILVDHNQPTRAGVKSGLFQHGIRGILDLNTMEAALSEFQGKFFDLLVLDASNNTPKAAWVMQQIRQGRLGNNSFITIIALIDEGDKETERLVLNAGADKIVTKPYSVNSIYSAIVELVTDRKPFVVTNDYVGPDRYAKSPNPSTNIPRFDVPNSLQAKVVNRATMERLQKVVTTVEGTLNEQKVRRDIVQVAWLLERIDESNRSERSPSEYFGRMAEVLAELGERGSRTHFAESIRQFTEMEDVVRSLAEVERPSAADIAELRSMAGSLAQDVLL
jgi:DNA-binding response OmpR family regulator